MSGTGPFPVANRAETTLPVPGAARVMVSDMSGIEHVKLSPDGLKGSTRELMAACDISRVAVQAVMSFDLNPKM